MEGVERYFTWLEKEGIRVSTKITTLKGLYRYLQFRVASEEVGIKNLYAKIEEKRKKIQVMEKVLEEIRKEMNGNEEGIEVCEYE